MSNKMHLEFLSNSSNFKLDPSDSKVTDSIPRKERKSIMEDKNYVTHKDLSHLEEKTDLKLDNIRTEIKSDISNLDTKIDGKFSALDEKFATFDEKLENRFLQQKIDTSKERREIIKWVIGTGVGVLGAGAAIAALFF